MNLDLAEKIVALLGQYPVSEIAVETETYRVHAVRPLGAAALPPAPQEFVGDAPGELDAADEIVPQSQEKNEDLRLLSAPMVGIFYHAEPPLSLGAEIKAGQMIGSIESMKLMNDVAAEESGRVVDVLVEDGAPVDYGRALFRLSSL